MQRNGCIANACCVQLTVLESAADAAAKRAFGAEAELADVRKELGAVRGAVDDARRAAADAQLCEADAQRQVIALKPAHPTSLHSGAR